MISQEQSLAPINTLIVGTGVGGGYHINAQKKMSGVSTVLFDSNPSRLQEASNTHKLATARNLSAGIDAADIVFVCTPDDKHTDIVLQALRARKPVYIEKPMATSRRDASKIIDAAFKHNVEGWVGTGYRLTPAFAEVHRRVVGEQELGRVFRMHTSYMHDMRQFHEKTPWRVNQDYLYGAGSHAVDLAWWIGGRVQNVMGRTRRNITMPNYKRPEAYDLILEFDSGATATVALDARSVQAQHGSDLKVWGETGNISSHNKIPRVELFKEGDKEPSVIETPNVYTAEIANRLIVDYLRGNRNNVGHLPELLEATWVMNVLDAAEQSVKHGRRINVNYFNGGPNLAEI